MSYRSQRTLIAITGAALFMVVLDNLIVASSMPSIQRSLHASLGSLQWVLDAYILSFAVLMLTAAALGERFGRRRVFTLGLVLFTGASAAGALAPNAGALVAARAIQGVGGAAIMPLTLTLIGAGFPPERRAWALGIWSALSALGVALGPIAGGVLSSSLSWHWIFWVNVPIGILCIVLAPVLLAESRGRAERPDVVGLALVSTGLLAAVWATVRADSVGWTATPTLAAYAAGTILLLAFLAWERRTDEPMVPLGLFSSRRFGAANAANFLLAFAMFAGFLMSIQFLTAVHGEGPISSGVHLLFWTAMPMLVAPVAGRLNRRWAPGLVAGAGLALLSGGLGMLALLSTTGNSPLSLAPAFVAVGAGIGLTVPSVNAGGLAAVAPHAIGKASGLLSTSRQLGSVFGVAIGVAIYQASVRTGDPVSASSGARSALAVAAGAAVLGAVVSATATTRALRRERASVAPAAATAN